MQATRLGNALANKTVILSFGVAAIAIGVLAIQMVGMSSELNDKSKTIELQNLAIDQHLAALAIQEQMVETKTAQLLRLEGEILAKEEEIAASSQEVDSLRTELAALEVQSSDLKSEITLLQSKIRSDEQYIADLKQQLGVTQEETGVTRVDYYALAVANGKSVVIPIQVDIINSGTGSVSVDVNNAQYEVPFQSAVRTAAVVASEYTGKSLSDKNIVVRLVKNDQINPININGPSAGAIIATMIIAGLTDSEMNNKVLVTGSINADGRIGTVGSVEDKAEAAIDFGAVIFLVPEPQEFHSSRIIVKGVSDIDDVVRYLIKPK